VPGFVARLHAEALGNRRAQLHAGLHCRLHTLLFQLVSQVVPDREVRVRGRVRQRGRVVAPPDFRGLIVAATHVNVQGHPNDVSLCSRSARLASARVSDAVVHASDYVEYRVLPENGDDRDLMTDRFYSVRRTHDQTHTVRGRRTTDKEATRQGQCNAHQDNAIPDNANHR